MGMRGRETEGERGGVRGMSEGKWGEWGMRGGWHERR